MRGRKGEFGKLFESYRKQGFSRVWVAPRYCQRPLAQAFGAAAVNKLGVYRLLVAEPQTFGARSERAVKRKQEI